MTGRRWVLAAAGGWIILSAPALAMTGALLLNAPLSVREAGMGQVSVGSTDVLRTWSNPALLAGQSTRGAVQMTGGSLFGGDLDGLGVGAGWLVNQSWAVGALAVTYTSRMAEVNANGDEIGTSLDRGLTAGGVVAAWRGSWLRAGVLVKGVSDNLAGDRATTGAADVGATGRWGEVGVAVAARNLGPGLRPAQGDVEAQMLPAEARLGLAYRLMRLRALVGAEYVQPFDFGYRAGLGAEWWYMNRLGLRAGAQRNQDGRFQVSAGFSVVYGRVSLDYAAVTNVIGLNHRMSFSYGFGRSAAEMAVAPPAPEATPQPAPAPAVTPAIRINVAVSELTPQGVSASDAAVIADMVRNDLVSKPAFNVVEKANMDKVLAEQAFQQTGCTSAECAVKLGKLLNVKLMVVGSFGKLMDAYVLSLRAVDVETGRIVFSDQAQQLSSQREVATAVRAMVEKFANTVR
ncbi:MAG: CsgG/HfaB family protein [Candidatus Coatesbacteria bacterium]